MKDLYDDISADLTTVLSTISAGRLIATSKWAYAVFYLWQLCMAVLDAGVLSYILYNIIIMAGLMCFKIPLCCWLLIQLHPKSMHAKSLQKTSSCGSISASSSASQISHTRGSAAAKPPASTSSLAQSRPHRHKRKGSRRTDSLKDSLTVRKCLCNLSLSIILLYKCRVL